MPGWGPGSSRSLPIWDTADAESPVPEPKAAFGDGGGTVRVAEQVERRAARGVRQVRGLGLNPLAFQD